MEFPLPREERLRFRLSGGSIGMCDLATSLIVETIGAIGAIGAIGVKQLVLHRSLT